MAPVSRGRMHLVGVDHGGGSAPQAAGQGSGAAANVVRALPGSPAQGPDQPGFTPMAAAQAAAPTATQAAIPALGTNDLPNPAIGALMPPAAAARSSDTAAMPGATAAKPTASSATSTLSAILAAPGDGDAAAPLAGGSQCGQGMGGSLSDNSASDKQRPFAPLASVSVVDQ